MPPDREAFRRDGGMRKKIDGTLWTPRGKGQTGKEKEFRMSSRKAVIMGVLVSVALTAAVPVLAQGFGGPRGPQVLFEELDLNGDGEISQEEMLNHHEGRFDRADADGDGLLTRDEMIAAGQARIEAGVDRMLERLDSDEDGAISQAEMEAAAEDRQERRQARMFDRLDADDSGTISAEEFEDAAERMRERRGGGHGFFGRDRG
jgi:Ca2+-binding EF-hand superfamily protein